MDFYKNWIDYKNGFGDLSGEFWLGLDKIHRLSAIRQNVLRVDLKTFENETAYAVYESFLVGNESEAYILNLDSYSGNQYSYKLLRLLHGKTITESQNGSKHLSISLLIKNLIFDPDAVKLTK